MLVKTFSKVVLRVEPMLRRSGIPFNVAFTALKSAAPLTLGGVKAVTVGTPLTEYDWPSMVTELIWDKRKMIASTSV